MLPSEIPKLPTDPTCERVSYCVETFPLSQKGGGKGGGKPSPGWVSVLKSFVSLLVFIFCPHFEEIGLLFWVSRVLHQLSEVVP